MVRRIPSADQLIPVLNAGRQLHSQSKQDSKKKMTKSQIDIAKEKIKKQSDHVIDTKSKLNKKAKISVKKARSKKNKYNVK
jgi:putative cell wall-binding protein